MRLHRTMSVLAATLMTTAATACNSAPPPPPPAAPPAPSVAPVTPPPAQSAETSSDAGAAGASAPAPDAGPAQLTWKPVQLPGVTGNAFLDYIAYERGAARVWVPVGSTGSVDVVDVASGNVTRIDGFKTVERENKGRKRTLGPSAASVGDGYVYVGNRATSEVCPIDAKSLKPAKCINLGAPIDAVSYVPFVKEVWVTTPKDQTLTVLDASKPGVLTKKTSVKVDGAPEGYAFDEAHGLFFTNQEDKGATVVIDAKTHKVKAKWDPQCGADGPRGMAFDAAHGFLLIACTDHVQVLDAAHDGAPLGKLDTGAGVDNIDVVDGVVYAAAGKAQKLTVARIDDKGKLDVIATATTSEGARNAVADEHGNAYVADGPGGRILIVRGVAR